MMSRSVSLYSESGRLSSDVGEERRVDGHIFDRTGCCSDAEVVLLEKRTKTVAVDEVDRWSAIAGGFHFGSPMYVPVVISKPLSPGRVAALAFAGSPGQPPADGHVQ